jgi:hypothetical protein
MVRTDEGRLKVSRAWAHLLSWLALAIINVATIWLAPSVSFGTKLALSAFDAGQLLVLGLGGCALECAFPRGSGGKWLILLGALAALVGWFWVAPDFLNFAERRGCPAVAPWLGVAAALSVLAAAVVGWLLSRPVVRWVPIALAAVAAAFNHHILLADYPGIHLLIAWNAATLATSALTGCGLSLAFFRRVGSRLRGVPGRVAVVLLLAVSLPTWLVLPSTPVLVQAFRTEGSVLLPFLARLHAPSTVVAENDAQLGPAELRISPAFLHSRAEQLPIKATQPLLVPPKPLVIFVTIEAMRGELLNDSKWRRRLPNLSRLADEAVFFTRARSPGSTTRNSLGQVFSGKYSSQLRWTYDKKLGRNLHQDATPRLSDQLGEAGAFTLHLSSLASISGKRAVLGTFKQEKSLKAEIAGQPFALSAAVVDVALGELQRRATQSVFLYMHWLDSHAPYDAAGVDGDVFERYVRELELCDASLGRLVSALSERGLLPRTVLVLSADHGEALGEHGIPHHGTSVYEELVHVPLLIRVPGVRPRRVDVPVTTLDITPTLLDLLGLPRPGQYMGQSLVGFLRGENPKLERPIAFDQANVRGLLLGPYKVIEDRKKHTVEIYDLVEDPREQRNLHGKMANGLDERLLSVSRTFFANHELKGAASSAND